MLQAGDHALANENVVQCALNIKFEVFLTAFVGKYGIDLLAKAYEENKELYDQLLDSDNAATQGAVLEALAKLVYQKVNAQKSSPKLMPKLSPKKSYEDDELAEAAEDEGKKGYGKKRRSR